MMGAIRGWICISSGITVTLAWILPMVFFLAPVNTISSPPRAPISSRFYSNSLYSQISLPPSSSTPLICFYFLPLFLSIGANFCYTPVVRQSPYSVQEFPCFLLFVSTKPAFSRVKNHVSPYSVVRLVLHFLDQRRFFY